MLLLTSWQVWSIPTIIIVKNFMQHNQSQKKNENAYDSPFDAKNIPIEEGSLNTVVEI